MFYHRESLKEELELDFGIPGSSVVRTCLPMQDMQETPVQSLVWDDPLEKELVTHSHILYWEIPWTEEPNRLHYMGSQRVRYDLVTEHSSHNLGFKAKKNSSFWLTVKKFAKTHPNFFFPFIFISWRLITLWYCSDFCHTLTWISHGFTHELLHKTFLKSCFFIYEILYTDV